MSNNNEFIDLLSLTAAVLLAGYLSFQVSLTGFDGVSTVSAQTGATVYVSPAEQTIQPGEDFTIEVLVDTNGNQVAGVDIDIDFDPAVATISSVKKGTGLMDFQELRNEIDNQNGSISYSASTFDVTRTIEGTGVTALTINGSVESSVFEGTYQFSFTQDTIIATIDLVNVLGDTISGDINVSISDSTLPTPTTSDEKPTQTTAPTATELSGDINSDGVVNLLDYGSLSNAFGLTVSELAFNERADLNGDDVINLLDFGILNNNFGSSL